MCSVLHLLDGLLLHSTQGHISLVILGLGNIGNLLPKGGLDLILGEQNLVQ